MLFAAATTTGESIDLHFGHTETFYIFRQEDEGCTLVDRRKVTPLSTGDPDHIFDIDRFKKISEALSGCTTVYCQRIGGKPEKEMQKRGIEVIEYSGFIKDIKP